MPLKPFSMAGKNSLERYRPQQLEVNEKARAWLARADAVIDLTELTRTTRLLLVGVAVFTGSSNGFTVSNLRLTNNQVNTVGTVQDVDS